MDIFNAAKEALEFIGLKKDYHKRLASIKAKYPNAYEKWTDKDDEELATLCKQEKSISEIAIQLKRQPSAIESRIIKLNIANR